MSHHKLTHRWESLKRQWIPPAVFTYHLEKIDNKGKLYMRRAEKKCRNFKNLRITFSPEAEIWIHSCQVYVSLLRWHSGKIRNKSTSKGQSGDSTFLVHSHLAYLRSRTTLSYVKISAPFFEESKNCLTWTSAKLSLQGAGLGGQSSGERNFSQKIE